MTHALHRGDCLELLRSMAPGSVEHCITDPPYEAECHGKQRRRKAANKHQAEKVDETPLDFAPMDDGLRLDVCLELRRLVPGWSIVFSQLEGVHKWIQCGEAAGLRYIRTMIWIKPNAQPQYSGDRPGVGYECMIAFWGLDCRPEWNGGGKVGVYRRNCGTGNKKTEHPTQKPVELMRDLVLDFTRPGERVLDPFAGAATTGVACKELGRAFVGSELDHGYHAIGARRLEEAKRDEATIQLEQWARRAPGEQKGLFE